MITSVWPAARIAKIDALSARLRSESASRKRGSRIAVTAMSSDERDDDAELADAEDRNSSSRRARAPSAGGGRARVVGAHAAASR